jgi:hypothetical protein
MGVALAATRLCVNDLAGRGQLARRLPRYWLTDHFRNVQPAHWKEGDYIESADPRFPLRFRKLALLSSAWGRYGRVTGLRGATLFRVR